MWEKWGQRLFPITGGGNGVGVNNGRFGAAKSLWGGKTNPNPTRGCDPPNLMGCVWLCKMGGGGTENEKNGEKMVTTEGKRGQKRAKGGSKNGKMGKKRQTLMGGNKGDKKGQKKGAKRDQKEVN